MQKQNAPVVTLDLGLPPDPAKASEGLATLQDILRLSPHTNIIVVTGNDDRKMLYKPYPLALMIFTKNLLILMFWG